MFPVMENNNTAEDERRPAKRKMALSSCDICENKEAKYRCPSCMKHTCSLACVKQHKTVSGCSGVRDKTAFVPLSEFDEMNLLSDYRFLEDSARLRQQSRRDGVLLASRRHPKQGMWMIRKAKSVNVTLKLLPKIFSKHRENSTFFKHAEQQFHWHLKIHFPQSDAVYSERCPDNKQLDQILSGYIHPSESDPVKRQKLKLYVSSLQQDIRVFLKDEQRLHSSLRYHELELKKSLQENLRHKTIIEYPEIFVVLKEHSEEYCSRRPDDSRAVSPTKVSRSSSPSEAHSQALCPVMKKPRVSEDEELEEGELRSEDEEDEAVIQQTSVDDGKLKEPVMTLKVTEAVSVNKSEEITLASGDVDAQEMLLDEVCQTSDSSHAKLHEDEEDDANVGLQGKIKNLHEQKEESSEGEDLWKLYCLYNGGSHSCCYPAD